MEHNHENYWNILKRSNTLLQNAAKPQKHHEFARTRPRKTMKKDHEAVKIHQKTCKNQGKQTLHEHQECSIEQGKSPKRERLPTKIGSARSWRRRKAKKKPYSRGNSNYFVLGGFKMEFLFVVNTECKHRGFLKSRFIVFSFIRGSDDLFLEWIDGALEIRDLQGSLNVFGFGMS